MLTNLLIAFALVMTTLLVILNIGRLAEAAERLIFSFNKIKSFIVILVKAYQNRHQFNS